MGSHKPELTPITKHHLILPDKSAVESPAGDPSGNPDDLGHGPFRTRNQKRSRSLLLMQIGTNVAFS